MRTIEQFLRHHDLQQGRRGVMVKLEELHAAIEGLLFVVGDEGITVEQLAAVLEMEAESVKEALGSLQRICEEQKRGIQIIEVAGGYRLTTRPEHSSFFKKLATSPIHSGLSQAALETLAIVAYRQPITRMEIEDIRGVKSEKAIQSLTSKLLMKEVGRAPGAGRPILYGTTPFFLDHFGLKSIDELPPLPEDIDEQSLEGEADLFFNKFEETWNKNRGVLTLICLYFKTKAFTMKILGDKLSFSKKIELTFQRYE